MVNLLTASKPLVRALMKLAGVQPQRVELEPGTVVNFWVPTQVNPNKPTVVLVHGFGVDGILTWMFQVPSLTGDYNVYVPDLLFFGDSFTDRAERSREFQGECLAKGLEKLGVDKCTLVGLSYGGMIGFKMAELYPNLVRSLVVSGSVLTLTESISDASLERIGFSGWSDYLLPNTVEGVKLLFEIGSYNLPWIPNLVCRHYLEAMFSNRKERVELLQKLVIKDKDATTPHLLQKIYLLWGEGDKIFNMEVAHNLKEQLGDNAVLHGIEKAGHLSELERPFVYTQFLKKILLDATSSFNN